MIDVQSQIVALCEMFGVKRENVKQIVLQPNEALVTMYRLDDSGHKFIEGKDAATEMLTFRIRT